MDLVLPLRPGDDNPELRYALRSWCAHLPHDRLWIVGDLPSWVTGVEYLPGNRNEFGPVNVYNNIRAAVEHPDVAEQMCVVNDDMYVTAPINTIPSWYRSTLAEHINLPGVQAQLRNGVRGSWWPRSLHTTLVALQAHGYADPISWELHIPFPCSKTMMAQVLSRFGQVAPDNPPQWRSLYGNMTGLAGEPHPDDCKAWEPGEVGAPFHSTDDGSFRHYYALLDAMFPTKCKYER